MARRLRRVPAQLARRAAPGAAGRAGRHRQPARSGAGPRQPTDALLNVNTRGGSDPAACAPGPTPLPPRLRSCARVLERVRAHVVCRQGRLRPARARGGRARCRRPDRALSPAARDAALQRGGRHRGRDHRAPGRDAPAALRRAEERPGRHRRARVPHAADLAAHGDPPLRRGRRRAAHREAGRPAAAPRARTASGCRPSSTTCSTSRASSRAGWRCRLCGSRRRRWWMRATAEHAGAAEAARVAVVGTVVEPVLPVEADPERVSLVLANLLQQRHPPQPAGRHGGAARRAGRPRGSLRGHAITARAFHPISAQRIFEKFFRRSGRQGAGPRPRALHLPGRSSSRTAAIWEWRARRAAGAGSGSPFRRGQPPDRLYSYFLRLR